MAYVYLNLNPLEKHTVDRMRDQIIREAHIGIMRVTDM